MIDSLETVAGGSDSCTNDIWCHYSLGVRILSPASYGEDTDGEKDEIHFG